MVVTDGVFSMDGTIAPLADICETAEKHNALVFIDECHATGFLGYKNDIHFQSEIIACIYKF